MGMPTTVEIVDTAATQASLDEIFNYFISVDERFSTYKPQSEISLFNAGKLGESEVSDDMRTILRLAEETKNATHGFFDIDFGGTRDPSGIVKGWAIHNAAEILRKNGFHNFYVEVGGDIEVEGKNADGEPWSIGIRNPFHREEIVKVLHLSGKGIATSGTAVRGKHIYNPKSGNRADEIMSLTVMGPNVYEADRFATGAFAMGKNGIEFIEGLPGFEGYMIDHDGIATYTTGFNTYTHAQ